MVAVRVGVWFCAEADAEVVFVVAVPDAEPVRRTAALLVLEELLTAAELELEFVLAEPVVLLTCVLVLDELVVLPEVERVAELELLPVVAAELLLPVVLLTCVLVLDELVVLPEVERVAELELLPEVAAELLLLPVVLLTCVLVPVLEPEPEDLVAFVDAERFALPEFEVERLAEPEVERLAELELLAEDELLLPVVLLTCALSSAPEHTVAAASTAARILLVKFLISLWFLQLINIVLA